MIKPEHIENHYKIVNEVTIFTIKHLVLLQGMHILLYVWMTKYKMALSEQGNVYLKAYIVSNNTVPRQVFKSNCQFISYVRGTYLNSKNPINPLWEKPVLSVGYFLDRHTCKRILVTI